jgi:cell division protein FtsQ
VIEALTIEKGESGAVADWKPLILKILVTILALFVAAELIFYVIVIPMTTQINLSVKGAPSIQTGELCSYAGITGSEKWISFDTASIASRLAANPLFEKVLVEKQFPDRVCITVVPRVAVAVTFGTVNGRTVPLEIDKSGMVFAVGQVPPNGTLPLVTGLTIENPVAGVRLNRQLVPLLQQLAQLESRNPVLLSSVSEIKIEQKNWGGYDLVVYPVHTPVRVRTDKALNEDALQYMMLVLDVVDDMKLNIDEIDIRAGTVAYRERGTSRE